MKIAVTSQNFKTITGHAGKTRRFIIFDKDQDGKIEMDKKLDLSKEMSFHEFQGNEHPVDEVDILITGSCGNGFIQKMSRRGIKVITTDETSILTAVQSVK
jgi:predicted Fe-Mo cluster-binding NifX family protein